MSRSDSIHWLRGLVEGDCVRRRAHEQTFLVYARYGDRVMVVHLADVTNPSEWLINGKEFGEVGQLKQGDQVHHLADHSEDFYIVTHVEGDHAVATLTKTITPDNHRGEWTLVSHIEERLNFWI